MSSNLVRLFNLVWYYYKNKEFEETKSIDKHYPSSFMKNVYKKY